MVETLFESWRVPAPGRDRYGCRSWVVQFWIWIASYFYPTLLIFIKILWIFGLLVLKSPKHTLNQRPHTYLVPAPMEIEIDDADGAPAPPASPAPKNVPPSPSAQRREDRTGERRPSNSVEGGVTLGPRGKPVKVVEKASAEETRLSLVRQVFF